MTLAELEQQYAAMGEPADMPGTWTPRERDAYEAQRSSLDGRIRVVRIAMATKAEWEPKVARDEQWLAFLNTARKTIADELLAAPARPRTDLERGRVRNLEICLPLIDRGRDPADFGWSLENLRLGTLMIEAGYPPATPIENQSVGLLPWFGSITETERRLKESRARLKDAESRLADALREPELTTTV